MNKAKFAITAVYGLVLFIFFLFTQIGYQPLNGLDLAKYEEWLLFIGLVIIMGFLVSEE